MKKFLEWNNKPENRSYLYHFFKDNCSTRIRDLIDGMTDGQFKETYSYKTGHTFRQIGRTYTAHSWGWDWIVDYLLSNWSDNEITAWDEMFIPFLLEDSAVNFQYVDKKGETVPLIDGTEILSVSGTYEIPVKIPAVGYRGLILGGFFSLLILAAWFLKWKNKKGGAVLYAVMNGIFAGFCVVFGTILFFMMFFSDHDYTIGNLNILFINPLPIVVFPLLALFKKNREKGYRILAWFWAALSLGLDVCLILKLFPHSHQPNAQPFLTALPVYISLTVPELVFGRRKRYSGISRTESFSSGNSL